MELTFRRPYDSITSIDSASLPRFTLITGINGSGKTQLLKAIEAGHIETSFGQLSKTDCRYFDWTTLRLPDANTVDSSLILKKRNELSDIWTSLRPTFQTALAYAARQQFDLSNIKTGSQLAALSPSELSALAPSISNAKDICEQIIMAHNSDNNNFSSHPRVHPHTPFLLTIASAIRVSRIIDLELKDILDWRGIFSEQKVDPFGPAFATYFANYRDLLLSNQLRQNHQKKTGKDAQALSDEEFLKLYGEAPWDLANQALQAANLDFRISEPDQFDYLAYRPQLRNARTGTIVSFGSLSSGERILVAMAFSVYHVDCSPQPTALPRLLLLDEIDAPLHPAMVRQLLEVILKTFVAKGTNVIMTTHSPSTVAQAPPDSVFVLEKGPHRLRQTSPARALNLLTAGVPTLSLSIEGRRQVFVESPNDVVIFEALYSILKSRLGSGRSLQFVATGTANALGQHINTGKDILVRLVANLVESGNQSVFGLIDRDISNEAGPRLHIVGDGERNGLENFLLDPLLLLMLIYRNCRDCVKASGLPESMDDVKLAALEPADLQRLVDTLQRHQFGGEPQAEEIVETEYLSGWKLKVRRQVFDCDDHDYQRDHIVAKLPNLKGQLSGGHGSLMLIMVNNVIRSHPGFLPMALFKTLKGLLEAEPHIDGGPRSG